MAGWEPRLKIAFADRAACGDRSRTACQSLRQRHSGTRGTSPSSFSTASRSGRPDAGVAARVVSGIARGCQVNRLRADRRRDRRDVFGIYAEGEYDIAGTIVGACREVAYSYRCEGSQGPQLCWLCRPLGLTYQWLLTLARRLLFDIADWPESDSLLPESGAALGDELLKVHQEVISRRSPRSQERHPFRRRLTSPGEA